MSPQIAYGPTCALNHKRISNKTRQIAYGLTCALNHKRISSKTRHALSFTYCPTNRNTDQTYPKNGRTWEQIRASLQRSKMPRILTTDFPLSIQAHTALSKGIRYTMSQMCRHVLPVETDLGCSQQIHVPAVVTAHLKLKQ